MTSATATQILRSVTYVNSLQDPTAGNRVVNVQCIDSIGAISPIQTSTITVIPINDPPVLDLLGGAGGAVDFSTSFSEGTVTPIPIVDSTNAFVSDVDNTIDYCEFIYTSPSIPPDGASEIMAATSTSKVNVTISSVSLEFGNRDGSATPADFTTAIRSMTYLNSAGDVTPGNRVLTGTCYDISGVASNPVIITITVSEVNQNPILDLDRNAFGTGFSAIYTEDTPAVRIVGASVVTTDNNLSIVNCLAVITNPQDTSEILSVNTLSYSGITAITGPNAVSISGTAIAGAYATILDTLSYQNTNQNPTYTVIRKVVITCTDSAGHTSLPVFSDVQVIPVNDQPIVYVGGGTNRNYAVPGTFTEGDGPTSIVPSTLNIQDVDSTNIVGCTIHIVNIKQTDGTELLNIVPTVGSIGFVYDSTTGIMTLSRY